jgi:hypothetical protein
VVASERVRTEVALPVGIDPNRTRQEVPR